VSFTFDAERRAARAEHVNTADCEDMLGEICFKHLLPADQYRFIAIGSTMEDSGGTMAGIPVRDR
jgi:hypothetical protein